MWKSATTKASRVLPEQQERNLAGPASRQCSQRLRRRRWWKISLRDKKWRRNCWISAWFQWISRKIIDISNMFLEEKFLKNLSNLNFLGWLPPGGLKVAKFNAQYFEIFEGFLDKSLSSTTSLNQLLMTKRIINFSIIFLAWTFLENLCKEFRR